MSGVHGDMLAYFPELMQDYDIFKMGPKMGAGYGPRITVFPAKEGYLSRNKGGKESVVTDLRTENQQATFWCTERLPRGEVIQGLYVEDDGELYQFVLDNAYVREGGFVRHTLQLVTGNNGQQKPAPKANLGVDKYQ